MGMKIGIVYGTKRQGATVQIVDWMKAAIEEQGGTVVAANASEFGDFGCDGYIVGSSVYAFSAKRTGIASFIRAHRDELTEKPVSLFIVCGSDPLPDKGEMTDKFLVKQLKRTFLNPDKYMKSLSRPLRSALHTQAVFKGYQDENDKSENGFMNQEAEVRNWALKALKGFSS
jgi:menaquinone-dependent protoporphyrinogen IX oxidase